MKRAFSILLATVMTLSLAACGDDNTPAATTTNTTIPATTTTTTPVVTTHTSGTTASATPKEESSTGSAMDATKYITTVAEGLNKASEEYITANQEFILDPEADTEMKLDRVMACKDGFYALANIGTPPEEYKQAHEQFVETAIKAGDLIEESVSLMRSYLNEELEGDYDDLSGELANELEDAFTQLSEDYTALVTIYREHNLESPSIAYEN